MREDTLMIMMPGNLFVLAVALHVVARLAYVFYIGTCLRQAEHNPGIDPLEQYGRWLRFKRKAALILNADAVTTALVLATSMNTLRGREDLGYIQIIGTVLVAIGVAVKVSAYREIGEKGYYWYNFFCDGRQRSYVKRGVYRYLDNPMYGPGYLHAIGFALIFLSFWGLLMALFDWIAVWVFHYVFERPHTLRHIRSLRSAARHRSASMLRDGTRVRSLKPSRSRS